MAVSFVLVHGASHGAWCWQPVVPYLEADERVDVVLPLDLPGSGARQDAKPHAKQSTCAPSSSALSKHSGQGSEVPQTLLCLGQCSRWHSREQYRATTSPWQRAQWNLASFSHTAHALGLPCSIFFCCIAPTGGR